MASRRPAVLLVAIALLAACSSTTREHLASEGDGPGTSSSSTEVSVEAGDTTTTTGEGADTTAGSGPTTSATDAATSSTARTLAMGRGVTATEINLGIGLLVNGEAFGNLFGIKSDFGNSRAQAQAVVDAINADGGIAGRKIKPIYYTFDAGDFGAADGANEQAACATWTEDNKVMAAVNAVLSRESLLTCLSQRDVPSINAQLQVDQQRFQETKQTWYSTTLATLDRQVKVGIDGLAAAGYFPPGAKVGVIYRDIPSHQRVVDKVMRPAITAAGANLVVAQPAPTADAVNFAAYVLRFQANGVTHVLFFGEGGAYVSLFSTAAEAVGYRPRYGLRTDNTPAITQRTVNYNQLRGAVSIGWAPIYDVDLGRVPKGFAGADRCLAIMKTAGQSMTSADARGVAFSYCDGLFLIDAALEQGVDLTTQGFQQGIERLGSSFPSAITGPSTFGPGRHDAPSEYRISDYNDGCRCFVYRNGGAPRPFP